MTLKHVISIVDVYSACPEKLTSALPRLMSLSNVVNNELKYEEQLLQLLGTMDAILSMSHKPHTVTNDQTSLPTSSANLTEQGIPVS